MPSTPSIVDTLLSVMEPTHWLGSFLHLPQMGCVEFSQRDEKVSQ